MTVVKPEDILFFETPEQWRTWLEKNHISNNGMWLRMYKKDSGVPSITYAGALDEALCFGWIDGQSKKDDIQDSWIQRFTPRRPKGNWSKRNTRYIERLTAEGKMQPAGIAEVEAAKADGRWEAAYEMPSLIQMPEDFVTELKTYPEAYEFYQTLNKSNLYAIYYQLHTAKKPETREKRKRLIIEKMKNKQKIH